MPIAEVNSNDLIFAQDLFQFVEHRRAHRIDFMDPSPVDCTHGKHLILQFDHRRARDRLTNGKLPGKIRPRLRRRLPPHDLSKYRRGEFVNGDHDRTANREPRLRQFPILSTFL
jgi:hypothetical protein